MKNIKTSPTTFRIPVLLVWLCLLGSVLPLAAGEKLTIAVMEFKANNLTADEVTLLVDFFNSALFETGAFDVVLRDKRDKLIKEIEFSYSDAADTQKTKNLGKLLSANLLVFGNIGKIGQHILFTISTLDVETGKTVSSFSKKYTALEAVVEDMNAIADEVAINSQRSTFFKKNQVLYADSFSSKNWLESEQLFYTKGLYNIFAKSEWLTWQPMNVEDFVLETTARFIKGNKEYGYGLVFKLQDTSNFCNFKITQNGYFRVEKVVAGETASSYTWEKTNTINTDASNILKVEAIGRKISFYINNNLVKEIFDDTFKEGKFGLIADGNVHAAFDSIIVYQGKLLLFDDFSEDKGNWVQDDKAFLSKDEYFLKPEDGYFSWSGEKYQDFSFKADMKYHSGAEDNWFGIIFHFQDINNYYTFNISKNGYYIVSLYLNGKWQDLVASTRSRQLNSEGKNSLKVECSGKLLKFYINNNLMGEVEDGTFTTGHIGFASFKDIKTSFDNVEVFSMD